MYNEVFVNQLNSGKEIILYQAPSPQKPKVKIIKKLAGLLLVVIAILAPISILGPVISAEINYRFLSSKQDQNEIISKIENISSPILTPKDQNFSLIIPKIRLDVPVIPNVDPADEKAYNLALKGGVAQAKGSVFPGEKGTIYIFGHSSNYVWEAGRYKTAFYLLKDLKENDIIVVSYNSKLFAYQIIDKKEVSKNDISWLLPGGEERLVLQTCWPPSTDWRRLVIVAKPLETNQNDKKNNNPAPDNVPGDSKAALSYTQ